MEFTQDEREGIDKVYEYIRTEFFKYPKTQPLPRMVMARIYGTMFGVVYKRGKDRPPLVYHPNIILATMIYCKNDIINCMTTMNFKDDAHKINTVFKILDNKIGMINGLAKRKKEEDEKLQNTNTEHFVKEVQPYKSKSEIKDKFKEYL